MNVVVVEDYAALSQAGADLITMLVTTKRDAALCVATGDTPMGVYRELGERRARALIDCSGVRAFQLDAYCGIAPSDRRSLIGWMQRSFIHPLAIPSAQVIRLPGDAPDYQVACQDYIAAVQAAGGFDLAILGLGPNGHLGFNEPPCAADAPTRVVELTEESIVSNARYWGGRDQVPRQALTCGMDLLLAARHTLLVVSGAHKHTILHRTLAAPPSAAVPASWLQLAQNVTVIADRAAWELS